jgi:site-specific DNA-methyltransferase (adenine-specific)
MTVGKWIEKATIEQSKGVTVVMLLPSRTDTRWFHQWIYNKPNVEIRFIKGRLIFYDINDPDFRFCENGRNVAPFPSMVVVFRV